MLAKITIGRVQYLPENQLFHFAHRSLYPTFFPDLLFPSITFLFSTPYFLSTMRQTLAQNSLPFVDADLFLI